MTGTVRALPLWGISLMLGITQTIGYGSLYYAFGVLTPGMSADTGLPLPLIYGGFSAAMIAGAVVAPRAGAMMDRRNPAAVMAAGSVLAGFCLAGWALVPSQVAFGLFLLLAELVSILVLYEAAFVVVAHVAGAKDARRVIAGITFVAGFASTIFWPLTQWLLTITDWRGIYGLYALLHLFVCAPLHFDLSRRTRSANGRDIAPAPPAGTTDTPDTAPLTGRDARLVFILLLVGFSATSFVISAVHLHLITVLGALGLGTSSALVGACIGPAQVGARVLEFATARRTSIHVPSIISVAMLPLALLLLLGGAPSTGWGIAFALAFGTGQGLAFIVRGILPLQAFGRAVYGTVTGRLNGVRLFFTALAPFVLSLVLEQAGPPMALLLLIGVGLTGTVAMIAIALIMGRATGAGSAA